MIASAEDKHGPAAPVDQPFLHDLVTCMKAPTVVLSGSDGQIRSGGVQGVLCYDRRVLSELVVHVDGHEPVRADEPLAGRLRLAGMVLVANPLRMAGLGVLLALFLGLATVAVAAIVTFALALACLVVARYVLPAADRLEGREAVTPSEPA